MSRRFHHDKNFASTPFGQLVRLLTVLGAQLRDVPAGDFAEELWPAACSAGIKAALELFNPAPQPPSEVVLADLGQGDFKNLKSPDKEAYRDGHMVVLYVVLMAEHLRPTPGGLEDDPWEIDDDIRPRFDKELSRLWELRSRYRRCQEEAHGVRS
jgi:hypothetical protein